MTSNHKLIVLAAAAIAVAGLILVLRSGGHRGTPRVERPVEVEQPGEHRSADLAPADLGSGAVGPGRVPGAVVPTVAGPIDGPAAESSDGSTERMLEGIVVDGEGAPIPAVAVSLRRVDRGARTREDAADSPIAITDDRGVFELSSTSVFGQVVVTTEEFVTVVGAPWPPRDGPSRPTVVVGARSSWAGTVVDRRGNALPGALVAVRHDRAVLRRIFQGEERNLEETWSASTGDDGGFAVTDVGWLPGTKLVATLVPFDGVEVVLDPGEHRGMQVVLERPERGDGLLHGRAVRADGGPVDDVQVTYAGHRTAAGAPDGTFVLDLGADPEPGALVAVLGGFLPAEVEIEDPIRACARSIVAPIVLELEDTALSISGHVVDDTGAPVAKAWVWTEDGTLFSAGRTIEDHAATETEFEGVGRRAEVDPEGKFVIDGLLDADYDLHAVDPGTFQVVTLPGVRAGADDARLVFDDVASGSRVAGRVLYRDGEPAPRVRLYPMIARRGSSAHGRTPFLVHSGRATDAEGRFEFESLFTSGLRLWVAGNEIGEPARRIMVDLDDCADLQHIEIRVPHIVRFEVVLRGDPNEADRFGVLDGDGRPLQLQYTLSGARRSVSGTGPRMKLNAGRSEVISCSEDARTLVLYLDGREVRRVPVRLELGELEVLEL